MSSGDRLEQLCRNINCTVELLSNKLGKGNRST